MPEIAIDLDLIESSVRRKDFSHDITARALQRMADVIDSTTEGNKVNIDGLLAEVRGDKSIAEAWVWAAFLILSMSDVTSARIRQSAYLISRFVSPQPGQILLEA